MTDLTITSVINEALTATDHKNFDESSKNEAKQRSKKESFNPWYKAAEKWFEIESPSDQGRIIASDPPLPKRVFRRVKALKKILRETKKFEEEFYMELHLLEAKYNFLMTPLYDRRANIISGVEELNSENESAEKGIPLFWETVFNHSINMFSYVPFFGKELPFVEDIRLLYTDNGFRIHFYFSSNPFFTNDFLSVDFIQRFDRLLYHQSIMSKRSKNDQTQVKIMKVSSHGRSKKKKLSRFNILQLTWNMDAEPYQIKVIDFIKDWVLTRAVLFYTGEMPVFDEWRNLRI